MGRPKKEESQEAESQVAEPKAPPALKYKVLSYGDYIEKARTLFGEENVWENAIALLYSENKVVAVVNKKGEEKFVVEA